SDVVYSGDRALKVTWNRDPSRCEWAGFGIGWDDWVGKDLSDIFEYAAIQMQVRTVEGKMFGLPAVLTFEDYSGGMAFAYVGASYFERTNLDEEWQKVTVPLQNFDINTENLDPSNIKQLMFELQQGGAIYLDDIKLIFYTPPPPVVYLPDEPEERQPTYPITLFADDFVNGNGWGLLADDCQRIQLTNDAPLEGQRVIHAEWDTSKEDCYSVAIGASWNQWFPVNLQKEKGDLYLSLAIKSEATLADLANVRIGFEDYERAKSFVSVETKYLSGSYQPGQWQTVRIPISAFDQAPFDMQRVKQLYIRMEGAGECWLDDIQLVR
ncbi:MAG: hypothetical protein AAGJ82_13850, partial [Bacteroidota bacterium]